MTKTFKADPRKYRAIAICLLGSLSTFAFVIIVVKIFDGLNLYDPDLYEMLAALLLLFFVFWVYIHVFTITVTNGVIRSPQLFLRQKIKVNEISSIHTRTGILYLQHGRSLIIKDSNNRSISIDVTWLSVDTLASFVEALIDLNPSIKLSAKLSELVGPLSKR